MKAYRLLAALSLAAALGHASTLKAQSMGLPLTVDVTFQPELELDQYFYPTGWGEFTVSLGSAYSMLDEYSAYSGWNAMPEATAKLRPGKKYTLDFTVDEFALNYRLSFAPIDGYRLIIDEKQRYRLEGPADEFGMIYEVWTVHLEPVEGGAGFGEAESIQGGDKIFWRVGMGHALNGASLGYVQIRQADFSPELFTPAVLDYQCAVEGVSVYYNGANLDKVRTPRGLMVVGIANSYTYELKFFDNSQVSGTGPNFTTTGFPFVKYAITKYGGSSTKVVINKYVVKNDGSTETASWSTRLEKNGSLWTLYDWTRYAHSTIRVKSWSVDSSGQTIEVRPSQYGTIVSRSREDYQTGGELDDETFGYGSGAGYPNLWTDYDYHTSASLQGRLKSMQRPDGSWIRYDYYSGIESRGLVYATYEPYMDSPSSASAATSTNCKYTYRTYEDDWDGARVLPNKVETKISNVVTSRSNFDYAYSTTSAWGDASLPLIEIERIDEHSNQAGLTTITKSFRADAYGTNSGRFFPGLVYSVKNPDGTKVAHAYLRGDFTASSLGFTVSGTGSYRMESVYTGSSSSSAGVSLASHYSHSSEFAVDTLYLVDGVSTRKDLIRDARGDLVGSREYAFVNNSWQLIGGVTHIYDRLGNLTKTERHSANGVVLNTWTEYTATYDYGLKISETDETTAATTYANFDAMGRPTKQTRVGYGSVPSVDTYFEYDAEGRVTC